MSLQDSPEPVMGEVVAPSQNNPSFRIVNASQSVVIINKPLELELKASQIIKGNHKKIHQDIENGNFQNYSCLSGVGVSY